MSELNPPRHWAHIEETSFAFGMWFMLGLYRCFGRWPFRLCLYPVIFYYWTVQPRARAASVGFLRRFARHTGLPQPGRFASLKHLFTFGEAILDKILAWSGGISADRVDLIGSEVSVKAIACGRGGIIVTAHLGNLELCNALSSRHKSLKLNILTHTRHSAKFNQMLGKLNPKSQINLIQVSDFSPAITIMLAEKVAAGEFVVIAGDRIPVSVGAPVVMAPFLGESAPFPVGPWVLASVLHCPVYLLWSIKVGARYWVSFEHFRDEIRLPRATRGAAVKTLVTEFAQRMESVCARSPLQWFNFFDFWALPPDMQHTLWI